MSHRFGLESPTYLTQWLSLTYFPLSVWEGGQVKEEKGAPALVLSFIHSVVMSHPLNEGFPDSSVRPGYFRTHSVHGY